MNSKSLESQKSSGVSSSDSSAADEEQVKQTKMKKKSQKISTGLIIMIQLIFLLDIIDNL